MYRGQLLPTYLAALTVYLCSPVMTSTQVRRGGEKVPDAGREAGREPERDRDCVPLHRLCVDGDLQPSSPRCSDCSCLVTCASLSAAADRTRGQVSPQGVPVQYA